MSKALILVDLQNDFMPGGALAVERGDEVIPVANRWTKHFENNRWPIVATMDWHPDYHISFASTHRQELFTIYELPNGHKQMMWPDHCVVSTTGAELHRDLELPEDVIYVRKGMNIEFDSYSGFADDNGVPTGLKTRLQSLGVDTVYIMGLALDYCVKTTALDAVKDFETFVVVQGCRPVADDSRTEALAKMKDAGIILHMDSEVLPK